MPLVFAGLLATAAFLCLPIRAGATLLATAYVLLFLIVALVAETGWASALARAATAWAALFCTALFISRLLLHGFLNYRGIPHPMEPGGVMSEAAIRGAKFVKRLISGS